LLLHPSQFNGPHGPSQGIDFSDVLLGLCFQLIGQIFNVVRARQGIDGVSNAGLISNNLLGAQGKLGRFLSGEGQRFVHGIGV